MQNMWNNDFPPFNLSQPPSSSVRLGAPDTNVPLGDPFIDVDFFSSLLPAARDPMRNNTRASSDQNPDETASSGQAQLTAELANTQSRPSKQPRSTEIKLAPDPRSRNMLAQRAYRRRIKVFLHRHRNRADTVINLGRLVLPEIECLRAGKGGGIGEAYLLLYRDSSCEPHAR